MPTTLLQEVLSREPNLIRRAKAGRWKELLDFCCDVSVFKMCFDHQDAVDNMTTFIDIQKRYIDGNLLNINKETRKEINDGVKDLQKDVFDKLFNQVFKDIREASKKTKRISDVQLFASEIDEKFVENFYDIYFTLTPSTRSKFPSKINYSMFKSISSMLLDSALQNEKKNNTVNERLLKLSERHKNMDITPEEIDLFVKAFAINCKNLLHTEDYELKLHVSNLSAAINIIFSKNKKVKALDVDKEREKNCTLQ